MNGQQNIKELFLISNIRLVFECYILCFGWFPVTWILCADVSEHSVCSIFVGLVNKKNKPSFSLHNIISYVM